MAINSQIDLILRAVFKGEEEFKRAQLAVARVLGSTEQLGNEAKRTGSKQEESLQQARKKADELAKAFEEVRTAEQLLDESRGTEQEADAVGLLAEEQKKLAQIIERNSATDSTANKKRLSEIQQIQTQLSGLLARQRELQALSNRSQAQNNELSTLNAQVAGLQNRITALRGGSTALTSATQNTNQNLSNLANGFSQINSFAPQSIQSLGNVTTQIVNVAKSLGATGAVAVGFLGITTAVTAALINQAQVTAKNAKVADEIAKSTGASAGFIGALTSVISGYGGEIQNVQELLLQVGSVINQAIAEPTGTTAEKFDKLGVAFRDVTGRARTAEQVIKDIDKAAKETGLTTEQLALVSTIFGEEASKQFLGRLGELDDLQKALEKTGAVITEELTAKAQQFNKSGQFLQALITGLSQSLSGELLDALTRINELTSEVLQNIDPTSLDALRSLIQDLGRALVATAETGAKAFQLLFEGINLGTATVIPGLADFAAATTAILNPLDTLNFLLTGNPVVADKANQSNKELVKTFTAGTFAADALSKKIKQLTDDQDFLAQITEITANQRIAFIQEQERLGLKSAQDAKREIDKIEDEKLTKQTDNAFNRLSKVKDSLQQETKIKQNEANQQAKIEEDLKNKRIAAEKEVAKFKRESFERQFNADGKDFASQRRLEEIKRQDAATLSIKLKNLETLRLAEASATENTKKAQKELSDFNSVINLNEIVDEKKFSEDKLKARKELQSATLALRKAEEEQNKKNLEQRKNDEKSILADRKTTIDSIEEEEKALTTKLAKELEGQKINQDQFNQQSLAEKIKFAQRKLEAEQLALAKLNASENASLSEKVAASQRVETLKTQITQDQITQRINDSKRELDSLKLQIETEQSLRNSTFESRKLQIAQIKDLNKKAIEENLLERDIAQSLIIKALEQVAIEQKTLQVLKAQNATKEEIERQQAKITVAITDSQKATEQLRLTEKKLLDEKLQNAAKAVAANKEEIDSLDQRSKAFIKGLDSIGNKLNQISEFFKVTFDPSNTNLDGIKGAETQLQKFRDILEETNKELLSGFGALSPLLQAQKLIIEDSIIDLENRIGEAKQRLAVENQRKANEAELAERKKGAEQALDIVKDFEDEANKLREDSQEKRDNIKDDILENAKELKDDLIDLAKQQKDQLDAFDQEQKDRELERADQQNDALLQKQLDFQAKLQGIKDSAEQEAANKQSEAAEKAAQIDSELQDLLKRRQNEKDPSKQKDLDEQIKKKQEELSKADKSEAERLKREERKKDEITKAQKEAEEKIKSAKSDKEVEEIEKALEIQLDGIDKKFKNEQKFADELAKFQGKISQERLDALVAAFEREQAAIETNTKNRLEAERKQAQLSEELRKKATDKEKAEIAQRRQDLIEAQKKELEDRIKAFNDKQKQLEEALKNERKEYKKHLEELRTKTAESLAEISKSFTDGGAAAEKFFTDFAKNAGLTGKAIDDILKKLKQFKDEVAAENQQTNNAANNSSSAFPTNPSNNTTNQGANPSNPSPPVVSSGGDNNGAPRIGIEKQPKNDKPGNQSGGVNLPPGKGNNNDPATFNFPTTANNANEFKTNVLLSHDEYLKKADFDKNGQLANTKKSVRARQKFANAYEILLTNYTKGSTADPIQLGDSKIALAKVIFGQAKQPIVNALDRLILVVEGARQGKDKGAKSVEPGSGGKVIDVTPPGGGKDKGANPVPEGTKEPPLSRGRDLTDSEQGFFANREKDAQNGDGEGASKKGFVPVAPDAAVGVSPKTPNQSANNPSNPSNPSTPTNNKASIAENNNAQSQPVGSIDNPTSQSINQNNNNQVTVNLQVQGFLGDNKTVNQLKDLFSDLMSQQNQVNQDRLRQLNGANLARRG